MLKHVGLECSNVLSCSIVQQLSVECMVCPPTVTKLRQVHTRKFQVVVSFASHLISIIVAESSHICILREIFILSLPFSYPISDYGKK